jgi:hypothetical protein
LLGVLRCGTPRAALCAHALKCVMPGIILPLFIAAGRAGQNDPG